MKKKKILYIKAQGLGDMISGIPFLAKMKEQGHRVDQTFYDMRYLDTFLPRERKRLRKTFPMSKGRLSILQLLHSRGLVHKIVYIPFGILPFIRFLVKNIKKYDEVIVPIRTKAATIIANIVGKKQTFIFQNTNDNSKYKTVSEGEIQEHKLVYEYKDIVQRPTSEMPLPQKYIVIFPSLFERSMDIPERIEVIQYSKQQGYEIIVVGHKREKRFIEKLQEYHYYDQVIDYLDQTSLEQVAYIVQNATINIMCNGGIMRLANLLNKNNINIQTVSAHIVQPTVDNKHSFNIRPYTYPECKPCEAASLPQVYTIKQCVFHNTHREGECRKIITSKLIIACMQKIMKYI